MEEEEVDDRRDAVTAVVALKLIFFFFFVSCGSFPVNGINVACLDCRRQRQGQDLVPVD